MDAQEIIEAADKYVGEHITCDCGKIPRDDCDCWCSAENTRRAVKAAYITGISAGVGLLIAEDGSKEITPYKIYEACSMAITLFD